MKKKDKNGNEDAKNNDLVKDTETGNGEFLTTNHG
jgi:hypothetical protein